MNLIAHIKTPHSLPDINGTITSFLVLFTCFGYPFHILAVQVAGIDSTPVNWVFRTVYLLISLYLILYQLLQKYRYPNASVIVRAALPLLALVGFWLIYGIRLVYDLEYKEWTFTGYHKYYVYSWAFGCSMIPALAVLMNLKVLNGKRFSWHILLFIFISNLIITLLLWYYSNSGISGIFSQRGTLLLQAESSKRNLDLINPITISFYGELLALSSLAFFFFHQRRLSISITIILVFFFLLGMLNILAGASRGPMVGFVLLAVPLSLIALISFVKASGKSGFFVLRKRQTSPAEMDQGALQRKSLFNKMLMTLLAVLLILTALNFAMKRANIRLDNLVLSERIKGLTKDTLSTNDASRPLMWKRAWYQFTVNPIFGDSIINDVGYFYSHNIFMDALMSVGIVGTLPFLLWFFLSFWYFIRLPGHRKKELSLLFTLYLAALLLSMTSGGIFTVPEVWILSAAVISLSRKISSPLSREDAKDSCIEKVVETSR